MKGMMEGLHFKKRKDFFKKKFFNYCLVKIADVNEGIKMIFYSNTFFQKDFKVLYIHSNIVQF